MRRRNFCEWEKQKDAGHNFPIWTVASDGAATCEATNHSHLDMEAVIDHELVRAHSEELYISAECQMEWAEKRINRYISWGSTNRQTREVAQTWWQSSKHLAHAEKFYTDNLWENHQEKIIMLANEMSQMYNKDA